MRFWLEKFNTLWIFFTWEKKKIPNKQKLQWFIINLSKNQHLYKLIERNRNWLFFGLGFLDIDVDFFAWFGQYPARGGTFWLSFGGKKETHFTLTTYVTSLSSLSLLEFWPFYLSKFWTTTTTSICRKTTVHDSKLLCPPSAF